MNGLGRLLRRANAGLHRPHGASGQVIVLFALSLVALLLVAGLVLDVARAYTVQQYQRSVTDAAALAGTQDLQDVDSSGDPTRSVSASDYPRAQCDAYNLLVRELGGSSPLKDCTQSDALAPYSWSNGTPTYGTQIGSYTVAITTPYAAARDPSRAVKVAISRPFPLTLGNLVCVLPGSGCGSGAPVWSPTVASVAELFPSPQYAVVTLQPPNIKNNGTDANLCKDLVVDGNNTALNVTKGDVGTNTSATTTNQGLLALASGYYVYHHDDITNAACGLNMNPTWSVDVNGDPQPWPDPVALITDPGYPYAKFPTSGTLTPAPTFTGDSDPNAQVACTSSPGFPTDSATVNFLTPASGGTLICYKPGIYSGSFTVSNKDIAYLMPGAYWFQGGVTVNGTLAGGLVNSAPGVVLVFPESGSSKQFLANNNNSVVTLNTGSRSCGADSCRATAATDFAGSLVQTDTTPAYPITVEVLRDGNCFVGATPSFTGCASDLNGNKTVKLTAGQLVQIAGVVYGPSDNMQITGGSQQQGMLGQLYSWTVTYTGGSTLTQDYPGGAANEVLRLSTVCSPGVSCP